MRTVRAVATGAVSTGALALGAAAFGAIAIATAAIGSLAIGRLVMRSASVGELRVRRLMIDELVIAGEERPVDHAGPRLQATTAAPTSRSTRSATSPSIPGGLL